MKVTIYLNSGQTIHLDDVENFETNKGWPINSVTWKTGPKAKVKPFRIRPESIVAITTEGK